MNPVASDGPQAETRVHRVHTDLRLLDGDELIACVAQPPCPPISEIARDSGRAESLDLATALFTPPPGEHNSTLRFASQGVPALVAFPEYAFASSAFQPLSKLVDDLDIPSIILAGFGITPGSEIRSMIECGAAPTWPGGASEIDPNAQYNCAWCWLHEAKNRTRCSIILKNYFEQTIEVSIAASLTPGRWILRVDAADLTLFPLICADLLCDQKDSPRTRISDSIEKSPPSTRTLAAGLLLAHKPHSTLWHGAINDLVAKNMTLLLANQPVKLESSLAPEVHDWRGLSGAFLRRAIMPDPPKPRLQPVRFACSDQASGLLLRTSEPGVSIGPLRWDDAPTTGRHVWRPNHCYRWGSKSLEPCTPNAIASELKRVIECSVPEIEKNVSSDKVRKWLANEAERAVYEIDHKEGFGAGQPDLAYGLLNGYRTNPNQAFDDADRLHEWQSHLVRGLRVLSALRIATQYEVMPDSRRLTLKRGTGCRLAVWSDPEQTCLELWNRLKEISDDAATSAEPLCVIGCGSGAGSQPPPGILSPPRRVDRPPPKRRRLITRTRTRKVWWCPLGRIEDELFRATDVSAATGALTQRLKNDVGVTL